MKLFNTPLPGSTNVKGSGVGSPAADVNLLSNALVEVRSSIPNTPADIGAINAAQLTALSARVSALIPRLNALKIPAFADSFNRTTIGTAYSITNQENLAIISNQLGLVNGPASFISINNTKTTQMYGKATILTASSTIHPAIIINYSETTTGVTSHYRGQYNNLTSQWELYKRVNGQSTLVATKTEAAPTGSYVIIVSQSQNIISLEVSNVGVKCVFNDSTPLTGKKAGMNLSWASSVDNAVRVDDFVFGDI